ncbi:F-box-like domain-containing protein [Microdochium nivale]|nr:F-box-like domain-containing protein [Microdochium nivale]
MSEPPVAHADRKLPIMSAHDGPPSAIALGRLPDEIIEQILLLADPNSFASLALLSPDWRRVSQQAHLYAHHLALCPATLDSRISPDSVSDDDLPKLRRLFSHQIKRNLFDAYTRPKITNITLISNAISSSSAPGGDGLQFSHSLRGRHLLAYNSSRIYLLDVQGPEIEVKREFKISRRPAAVCIVDDATLLAVLSTDMQIDLYDLLQTPPRRKQSLSLDHAPRAIALSPCGSVLAAAYQGGIEVQSIAPGALPTERRAVKCDAVDSLAFSFDGTQLLGTTSASQPPNTVILTAPYYDPGSQMIESNVAAMWTTSILFPNTSRDCSHAVLLQESSSVEAEWSFTYDRSFETFRAVRIADLRNGTTYFPGPVPGADTLGALIPSTLPAANLGGQLVSAGFESKDVWVYGVPEDLEAVPEASASLSTSGGLSRGPSNRSATRQQEPQLGRVPQWQVLCDKLRNSFVYGRKVAELQGVNSMKWVSSPRTSESQARLVVCAKGAQPAKPITEEDDMNFVDGGRVTIIDFDYTADHGSTEEITIDVGTQQAEVLEVEQRDLATEVAIVRRRTVAQQRRGPGGTNARSTVAARQDNSSNSNILIPPVPQLEHDSDDPLLPRRMATARDTGAQRDHEDIEDATLEEVQEALDAPYGHADPRSVTSLRRAATAAAMSRHRVPHPAAAGPVEYRRADGRREHPHESDADNWVPPPPPYSKDDPVDLPSFLRHAAIPGAAPQQDSTAPPQPDIPPVPPLPRSASTTSRHDLPRLRTSPTRERPISLLDQSSFSMSHAAAAMTASTESSTGGASNGAQRSLAPTFATQQGLAGHGPAEDNIYDISPPTSPHMAAARISPQTTGHSTRLQLVLSVSEENATPNQSAVSRSSQDQGTSSRLGSRDNEHDVQSNPASRFRRLSNSLTWPRAPRSSQALDTPQQIISAEYPLSAPPRTLGEDESFRSPAPPLPRPEQVQSLHNRQSSIPSRRASGMVHASMTTAASGRANDNQAPRQLPPLSTTNLPQQITSLYTPEQPLIISTPQGISGAYDAPPRGQQQLGSNSIAPVIHAPVARHPRPIIPGSLTRGSTAERLETIYSPSGTAATAQQDGSGLLSPQLTTSSLRYHTSVTRRESRARRSAARNMQDAKSRGWRTRRSGSTGSKKNSKKMGGSGGRMSRKDKGGDADGVANDVASNGGWTDVTWAPRRVGQDGGSKDKKCIIM